MRRLTAIACLVLAACATPKASPGYGVAPARMLAQMSHARLAPLRAMTLSVQEGMDQIVRGGVPTGSGQIVCSTSASPATATWQTPASCGLATGTNYWTLSTNTLNAASGWSLSLNAGVDAVGNFGWSAYPATATNMLRYQFGDAFSGLQLGSGDRLQLYAYHGIEIRGGRAALSTPTAVTGGSASDPSLIVVSSASGGGLRIDTNGGTAGTAISFSGRATASLSAFSCAASTCTAASAISLAGAALGAECITSRTTTGGAVPDAHLWMKCGVTVAGTVELYCCNQSTGALSITGTYSVRVFNP